MTDYHCNTTSYTYTDTGQLSTLTAPGSRTWDYDYNALGQPTQVTLPNGMYTTYGYDARNRMTQIHHHTDATTTALRLDYALDAGGNITGVSEYQGTDPLTTPLTTWAYGYDGRGRLTNAVRSDGDQSISATYTYAYDAGDNMLSKSEPFLDDFEDLNCNDWGAGGGWSASGGVMSETASAQTSFYRNNTDPDFDLRLRYKTSDTASGCYGTVTLRDVSAGNMLILALQTNGIKLMKQEGGVYSQLVFNGAATAAANTWYDLRVLCDGGTVTVWRGTNGGAMEQVLTTSTAPFSSTTKLSFASGPNSTFSYDDIRVIGSSLSNIGTTFACNAGNELTSQTQNNVTTNFTYDAWGRMATKSRGNYSATYAWGQGDKLTAVTTNFPGEGNVTYTYGADGKRRTRNDGVVTNYRLDLGWGVVNEEVAGALSLSVVPGLAEIAGPDPSTGTIRYAMSDLLGSLRALYASDKSLQGNNEYTPYGEDFLQAGVRSTRKFTGLDWDEDSNLYFAPVRYLDTRLARWTGRDPITPNGVPNLYTYTVDNPIMYTDPSGAIIVLGDDSPEDNARIQNALDLLKRWTSARSRILEIEKSSCVVKIIITPSPRSSSTPSCRGNSGTAEVRWQPNEEGYESELKLAHELYHVCLSVQGREQQEAYLTAHIPNHPMPSAEFVDYQNRVEKQLRERRHRSNNYHRLPKGPKDS
jgi:RHS repeat-associated protein